MATVRIFIPDGQSPTDEQIKNIREAAAKPILYDDDCPKLTQEQLKKFKRVSDRRNVAV